MLIGNNFGEIKIFSRDCIVDAINSIQDKRLLIISVNDPGERVVDFPYNTQIESIVYLSFDDVEDENGGMTERNAEAIKTICDYKKMRGLDIYINCEFGISRSAGIAAALSFVFKGENESVFTNPELCPNMLCYRRVREAFGFPPTDEELRRKADINRIALQNYYNKTEMEFFI